MIITVDGPAKSGKSTAGQLLADALGYPLLNTGAMYRAVGLMIADRRIAWTDLEAIAVAVHGCRFEMAGRVTLNGIDYTDRIGTPEAGQGASQVGELIAVRRPLQAEQRRIVGAGPFVTEGRDQGTVVFPEAPVKFYITASVAVRATRQMAAGTGAKSFAEIVADLADRDQRDMRRALDPLYPAADALLLSTDTMNAAAVAAAMRERVEQCRNRFTA
jgi:cytidylate kinase